jgi:hypothetical protein
MADVMRYLQGPKIELALKKTGTVAISIGDLVKRVGTNGRIMRISTSTDATALVGVAMQASPTTDPTATIIKVYQIGYGTIFKFISADADTAFKYGQMFVLTSAQPQQLTKYGTAGSNPNTSASNVVAVCAKELEASGSTVRVTFLGSKYNKTIVRGA